MAVRLKPDLQGNVARRSAFRRSWSVVVRLMPDLQGNVARRSAFDAEVEYRAVNDPSVFVKFPLKGKKNEYFLIWTTTPWTLPANVAVAVAENFEYAKVIAKKDGEETLLWMAEPW